MTILNHRLAFYSENFKSKGGPETAPQSHVIAALSWHNHKLSHHSVVLVIQEMAVVHIWSIGVGEIREAHNNAHGLTRAHHHRIFQSSLVCRWGRTISIYDLELDVMNVERMSIVTPVDEVPDLNGTKFDH